MLIINANQYLTKTSFTQILMVQRCKKAHIIMISSYLNTLEHEIKNLNKLSNCQNLSSILTVLNDHIMSISEQVVKLSEISIIVKIINNNISILHSY